MKRDIENSIREFFKDIPEMHADKYVQTAIKRYKKKKDLEEALEWATFNTKIRVDFPDRIFAEIDEALGSAFQQKIQSTLQPLSAEPGSFSFIENSAYARLQLRVSQAEVAKTVLSSLIGRIPENIPAAQLRFLIADVLAPPLPLVLADGLTDNGLRRNPGNQNAGDNLLATIREKIRVLVRIFLEALGVGYIFDLIWTETTIIAEFEALFAAMKSQDRKLVERALKKILEFFLNKLGPILGKKLTKKEMVKFMSKILSRQIPFIGWAVLIGAILFSIYSHWDELMDP